MYRMILVVIMAVVTFSCTPKHDSPKILGAWVGKLIVNENVSLRIGCEFKSENDSIVATMASIDQNVYGIEIDTLRIMGDSIKFSVNQMGVIYNGHFLTDTTIEGEFKQGSRPPLVLNFKKAESIPGAPPVRYQYPEKPYPYIENEVEFTSSISGFKLAGTLTTPKGAKKSAAVVLITGSGPNDRDETIWGHKVFLVLADYLTRRGITVLRMDDRGVGQSGGEYSTASMSDFADDASVALDYLKSRRDLNIGKVGIIGHSLGADIAPLVANRNDVVDFVVLLAGAGIPLSETIHMQTEHIYGIRGASKEAIDLNRRINQAVFDVAAQNIGLKEMQAAISQPFIELSEDLKNISQEDKQKAELPENLNPEDYYGFFTNNMRFDLFYNPSDQLRLLKQPILILGGDLDTQVSTSHNFPLMIAALEESGNEDVTTKVFPNMNHLFQSCKTGEIEEYTQIGETMSPIVLKTISDWIGGLE